MGFYFQLSDSWGELEFCCFLCLEYVFFAWRIVGWIFIKEEIQKSTYSIYIYEINKAVTILFEGRNYKNVGGSVKKY